MGDVTPFPGSGSIAGGGGPPHDPRMESRVAQLEKDTSEIKATLARLEPMIVQINAQTPHQATKADVTGCTGAINVLSERVVALDGRLGRVEKSVETTVAAAIGKTIGPWQLPPILAASAVVLGVVFTGFNWLSTHSLFGTY